MATPISRANFADLLDPAFRKIYSDAEKELSYKYQDVFNVYSSSKNLEKDSGVSGLGQLVEKTEGGTMAQDTIYQGYDVRLNSIPIALIAI